MSTQKTNIKGALALAGIVAAMAALGAISESDAEVRQQTQATYCDAVAIWRAEAQRGIAPERRAGQPDYKSTADAECDDLPAKIQAFTRKHQQLTLY